MMDISTQELADWLIENKKNLTVFEVWGNIWGPISIGLYLDSKDWTKVTKPGSSIKSMETVYQIMLDRTKSEIPSLFRKQGGKLKTPRKSKRRMNRFKHDS